MGKIYSPQRILIVRMSAIGDTVHTLPLAAALKKIYPSCFLGWVVEKPSAALVVDNPLLGWTYVLPKGWLKSPSQVWTLRRELRLQRFDVAFDVQGLTKSAVAAWLSGAPVRIGFTRGEAREAAPLFDNRLVAPLGRHAVDMTLSLLAGLGEQPPGQAEFVFPLCTASDAQKIGDILSFPGYREGFVLMGPWGSFPSKLWPLDRFGETAGRIHAATGVRSLVLGHGEKERAAAVALAARHPDSLAVAPDVSLAGVAELARRAKMFLGCDSFPMHAAAGVGCPTLGLFGVTDPERLGPYGPTGHSLYARLTILKSSRERRNLHPDNMFALSVEDVAKVCLKLLGTRAETT